MKFKKGDVVETLIERSDLLPRKGWVGTVDDVYDTDDITVVFGSGQEEILGNYEESELKFYSNNKTSKP